ncbi:hypothetical protein CathTA2_0697 [Caldalkalibacillus thermarum TA2.A1]|nr:hypothetical protein [Caldalkalibacillus thermarum]EGL83764.1 hypothetical protein CathTA2_0697 [Caldalkalibacillus thermarum TA2.A1]
MNKNLLTIGSVLLLSGSILLGIMHLAIALYVPTLTGWGDPPGKFATVLNAIMGWFPYILSIIFISTGMVIMFISQRLNENKNCKH